LWWNPLVCGKVKFLRYGDLLLCMAENPHRSFTFKYLHEIQC
jgi:hypothetical protein